ncbi:LysR family transcriptional regulator [Microbacterium kribbense]|uniref:LysR family transcriptional regulator n=1 Tax=Microbacterium kribbense TaxID=433645 RepID=A0ABP7GXY9_9MICO
MTLAQIRAFLAAYDTGTFTAAAAMLGIKQVSVSELVARLEAEVGLELFTRGARRLSPTAAAEEFRGHAIDAINALEDGVKSLRSITSLEGGVSTFGVLRNAAYYDLADLVQRFHKRYPNVRIRMVGLNSALVADAVAAGEIECALVVLPIENEGLSVRTLFHDEVLYVSTSRSTRRGPVRISELADASLVLYDAHTGWRDPTRHQIQERAQAAGVRVEPIIEVEHVETAISLVAAGVGDSFISKTIIDTPGFPTSIRTFPFAEPLYDTLALVRREDARLSPATRKFADLAERMLLSKVGQQGS